MALNPIEVRQGTIVESMRQSYLITARHTDDCLEQVRLEISKRSDR